MDKTDVGRWTETLRIKQNIGSHHTREERPFVGSATDGLLRE